MTKARLIGVVSVAVVLVAGVSGWLWWTQVRQNPNRVFWDMISNNLSTGGVTHISEQHTQGLSVTQSTQLSFGQHPKVRAMTVFVQNGNTLATEQVSDSTSDYVRYQKISLPHTATNQKLRTDTVVGKWARLEQGQGMVSQATSGLFKQSILDILPIANLSVNQRQEILGAMHRQSLFIYNPKAVKKTVVRGRAVYMYSVSIKPEAYVRIMQQFEPMVGATAYQAVKPQSFAGQKPLSVVIAVDARSHTLSQVYDVARERTERYEGFGIIDNSPMPKADITTAELTQRLGQLLQ